MNALLICGSSREGSHTRRLINFVAAELSDLSVDTTIWDLAERPIPPFEVPFHKDQSLITDDDTNELLGCFNNADMVVLGTPLYHGSYSGVLKNTIDYLLKDQLFEKPVGLVCNGGGNTKTTQAMGHLVTIVQTLYGVPMQTHVGTHGGDFSNDENLNIIDVDIQARCKRLANELVRFSEALKR